MNDTLSDTTRITTNLSFGTKYYWRVQVKNSEGTLGPWSEISNFSTFITLPTKTQLVAATPLKGRADYIKLKWRKLINADEYLVQMADEQGFTSVLSSKTTSDTVNTLNGTVEGHKFYWRVKAINIGGPGPWSEVGNFTIIIAPTTLKLQKSAFDEITLSWKDYSEVEDGFVIERKQGSDTSFTVIDTSDGNSTEYVDTNVEQGAYTYRVKAYKDSMESLYSNEASLTLVGIQEEEQLPTHYSISQNYPNPFNPTTKINFALPKTALIKIIIYDLLGREIRTLINKKLEAGYHEINFDAYNLPGGIYFYRIQSGYFIHAKKMILLK